jgi:hypothetical protein
LKQNKTIVLLIHDTKIKLSKYEVIKFFNKQKNQDVSFFGISTSEDYANNSLVIPLKFCIYNNSYQFYLVFVLDKTWFQSVVSKISLHKNVCKQKYGFNDSTL